MTDRAAIATWVQHGGRARPWQIVGPRHARSQAVAARGSGPAEDGGFDTAGRGRQDDGRSGRRNRHLDRTKEQSGDRGLAVAIARRLQSLAQWWVRLTKPRTQKFGHSPLARHSRVRLDTIPNIYTRHIYVPHHDSVCTHHKTSRFRPSFNLGAWKFISNPTRRPRATRHSAASLASVVVLPTPVGPAIAMIHGRPATSARRGV